MKTSPLLASLLTSWALVACGGGGDSPAPAPAPAASPSPAPSPSPSPAPSPAVAPPADARTSVRAIDLNENCPVTGPVDASTLTCIQGSVWGVAVDPSDQVIVTNGASIPCVLNVSDTVAELSYREDLENTGTHTKFHTVALKATADLPDETVFETRFANTDAYKSLSHQSKKADNSVVGTFGVGIAKNTDGSYRLTAHTESGATDTNFSNVNTPLRCLATIAAPPAVN